MLYTVIAGSRINVILNPIILNNNRYSKQEKRCKIVVEIDQDRRLKNCNDLQFYTYFPKNTIRDLLFYLALKSLRRRSLRAHARLSFAQHL